MLIAPRGVSATSTVLLPHAASSVATARQAVSEDLLRRGCPTDLIEDTVLVLSEVLSNALRHARSLPSGDVRLQWSLKDAAVEVGVTDGGSTTSPRASAASMSATGGRGLSIVERLAREWGVVQDGNENTVWAVLAARSRPTDGRSRQ